VARAWQYLYQSWLARSGLQPTNDPAMEVFHAHPAEVGWNEFDIDSCVPVQPLR
jgi:DNA gyrase inhibitor GyrI